MTAAEATTGTDRSPTGSPRVAASFAFLTIAAVGLVLPLVVARHYGALGAARGDDWSYLVTLFRWVDTGRLEFNNWVSMSLLGQLVLAAPIAVARGHAIALVQGQTAVFGFVGLVALALIGRRLGLAWGVVTFVVVTTAVSPLWLILCTTFMTDVPAFATSMVGLLLATIALQRRPVSMTLLITGLAVGLYAVTIRQYAIVPVIATALAAALALRADPSRRRTVALTVTVVVGILAIGLFFTWWYSVPDAKAIAPTVPSARALRTTVIKGGGFLRLAGLLLIPVVCYRGPIRLVREAWRSARALTIIVATGTALWQGVTATRYTSSQFVGNYVIRDGALSIAVLPGTRPPVMPPLAWDALVLVGSVAAIVLALAVVPTVVGLARRLRDRDGADIDLVTSLLGLTVFGFGVAYGIAMLASVQVYDRYALPALALVALLLARRAPTIVEPGRIVVSGIALAALAVVGLNAAVDSASFDGARWRLAERVVAQEGWKPKQINGGFEWVNFHRGRRYTVAARPRIVRVLPDGRRITIAPFCVNLRVRGPDAPPNGRPAIATAQYVALLRGPVRIVAARSSKPCVPPADSRPAGPVGGPTPSPKPLL